PTTGAKKKRRPLAEASPVNGSPPCRCGETTLNPRFKWERSETFGLPATWRTCTPGVVASPVSFLRDKANVLPAVEHGRERGWIIAPPRPVPSPRGVRNPRSPGEWFSRQPLDGGAAYSVLAAFRRRSEQTVQAPVQAVQN